MTIEKLQSHYAFLKDLHQRFLEARQTFRNESNKAKQKEGINEMERLLTRLNSYGIINPDFRELVSTGRDTGMEWNEFIDYKTFDLDGRNALTKIKEMLDRDNILKEKDTEQ